MDPARASVDRLVGRVASLPDLLDAAVAPALPDLSRAKRYVVTGVGASEGPARLFAAELMEHPALAARFVPISAFVGSTPPEGDALVVVSQGLSPNARLPLRHRARYGTVLLVTSCDPRRDPECARLAGEGITILTHGPEEEERDLLRVVGPTLAVRMLLHVAEGICRARGDAPPPWAASTGRIASAMRRARDETPSIDPAWLFGPTAIVTTGSDVERAPGLATKLLESLVAPVVSIWDLCGIVHGPVQSFYDSNRLLLVLETSPEAKMLRERLERILLPQRHRVDPLRATLPAPLSYFELAAAFDMIVVSALSARPRDLTQWPAKGMDGPIYDLGRE